MAQRYAEAVASILSNFYRIRFCGLRASPPEDLKIEKKIRRPWQERSSRIAAAAQQQERTGRSAPAVAHQQLRSGSSVVAVAQWQRRSGSGSAAVAQRQLRSGSSVARVAAVAHR